MTEWRGDKTVLAANRRLAAEAAVAELAWRRGLARKGDAVPISIRVRQLARSASRAAAKTEDFADMWERIAERVPELAPIAAYHRRNADAAVQHATQAVKAVERAGIIKEIA